MIFYIKNSELGNRGFDDITLLREFTEWIDDKGIIPWQCTSLPKPQLSGKFTHYINRFKAVKGKVYTLEITYDIRP